MPDRDRYKMPGQWRCLIRSTEEFGVTGKVSGLVQRGTSAQMQDLVALNYIVSRALVLDVAMAVGMSRATPDWQFMAGTTVRLGHWF